MKKLIAASSGACVLMLLVAAGCGGNSFGNDGGAGSTGASGAASGGKGSAGSSGSPTSAGSSSGGSESAGAAAGGSAPGGSAPGGATSTAGAASGGTASGGSSTAGASSGGASSDTSCEQNTDCMACAYPTAPASAENCYCANCAATPMSKSACSANQMVFAKVCANVHRPCPAIVCVAPEPPVCAQNTCVSGTLK